MSGTVFRVSITIGLFPIKSLRLVLAHLTPHGLPQYLGPCYHTHLPETLCVQFVFMCVDFFFLLEQSLIQKRELI